MYGEPDIIDVRKTFDCPEKARNWEMKVLRRMRVVYNSKWLNKTDHIMFVTDVRGEKNPNYGKHWSEEWKLKHSKIIKEGYKNGKYNITLKKLKSIKGPKHHFYGKSRPEHAEKLAKCYDVITPTGEKLIIKNLAKFYRENDLCKEGMRRVLRKEQVQYKGWFCFYRF